VGAGNHEDIGLVSGGFEDGDHFDVEQVWSGDLTFEQDQPEPV
jgi:hypothetical protein